MAETVLVTGGAKRIGRQICLGLAEAGFSVVVHHRNSEEESSELVDQIRSLGSEAESVRCDLSEPGATSQLISKSVDLMGPISHLVNNASVFEHDDIHSMNETSWDLHLSVNAKAQTMLIQSLAREFSGRENRGSVVNILDQKIASPNPDHLSYTASRFAMMGLTEVLARGLAPSIRVNGVAPGHTIASPEQTEEGFRIAQAESPLGTGPTPEDVADAVLFLINAKSVTGQIIFVDSGERFLNRNRDVVFETED
jgi:NAD(P)-dependent dehydrogenase (short-subunit alcohol dehydrogenase family)